MSFSWMVVILVACVLVTMIVLDWLDGAKPNAEPARQPVDEWRNWPPHVD